ncbi:hypothetical protein PENTCL1PPCAC_17075, partial [Pristionchus entomophagus]
SMICFAHDANRDPEDSHATVEERRRLMALVRWCPIIIFAGTLVAFVFIEHTQIAQHDNNLTKRARAEHLKKFLPYPYDSNEITGSRGCFWPILTDDDLALLDPREKSARIDCKPRVGRLFSLQESGILIPEVANNDFTGVECMYRSLDNLSTKGEPLSSEGPTFIVGKKRIFVECLRNESIIYSKEFFNFAAQPKLAKMKQQEPDDLNLSLSIITLDSVSLSEFHRLMPLSSQYMRFLGFVDSEMFNKKDLNQTIDDLLVGGEKPVWEVMREKGCISYIGGGISNGSLDNVDFVFDDSSIDGDDQCSLEGTSTARDNLETLERFHLHYSRKCTISLQKVRGFREQLSEDNGRTRWFSQLAALDTKLRSTLERLVSTNLAKKAVIVVMGDLGNNHNKDTFAGRVQQSTPFFSIRMPHGFRSKRPDEAAMLYSNRKRLTSNDDIAETFQQIAQGFEERRVIVKEFDSNGQEKGNFKPTSLFAEQYNDWRGCGLIGIEDETCQCLITRKGRSDAMSRGTPEYSAVFKFISSHMSERPCIQEVINNGELDVLEPGLISTQRTKE